MATVVTHAIVAAGLFRLGAGRCTGLAAGAWTAAGLSMLPDADVIGWNVVRRDSWLWHRGITHSLVFAAATGVVVAWWLRKRVVHPGGTSLLALNLAVCTATHGFLDAFTDGGSGVAFLLPFSGARTRFAAQPIPVAPISIDPTRSQTLDCFAAEAALLWPVAVLAGTAHVRMHWTLRAVLVLAVAWSVREWIVRT